MYSSSPSIPRSLTLHFIGDWGGANFHRICSWLCQEFCERSGPKSRVAIWNKFTGGMEALSAVQDGEAQLCVCTPAMIVPSALTGKGIFAHRALPDLRALAVLPQNDRLVLAIDPKFGITNFEALRLQKPALRIATCIDRGSNLIGYVARRFMEAHGVDEETLKSWGGCYVSTERPEQALFLMRDGEVDAVLQEAIMTPWWEDVIRQRHAVPIAAEDAALRSLEKVYGFRRNSLPTGYWNCLPQAIATLDFSDFVILVRNDMDDDVAHLLTWCLVETRQTFERQYHHLPSDRSPLTYPLTPAEMAKTPIPLHPGARRYFEKAGYMNVAPA